MIQDQLPGKKKPEGLSRYIVAGLVAAMTSVLIYAGIQYYFQASISHQPILDNQIKAQSPNADHGLTQLKRTSESFRFIAKKVGPAVVNIRSATAIKPRPKIQRRGRPRSPQQPPQQDDDEGNPFPGFPFDFFERFGSPFEPFGGANAEPQVSLGSGIIVDSKGYVVTNSHVVKDGSDISIMLSDEKTKYKAKIIGTDPRSDLAVLKIEKGTTFPTVEWADSDTVEVGDWAIAIGSPFALGQSVTLGIVSAKGRTAEGIGGEMGGSSELIQTDAAINPGNSGGPLVDLEGKVMGVNEAIYTRSGGYMGIGFAIPSNTAKDVVNKLIKDGKIVRGWLGVLIQPLSEDFAKKMGISEGVRVHEVVENSPASKAGLEAGDVILEVEGTKIAKTTQLQRVVSGFKPNETVKMKIYSRSTRTTKTISVKLGDMPKDGEEEKTGSQQGDGEPDKLGLVVGSKGGDGVTVEYVQPGSVSEQIGLQVGDKITMVNDKKIDSLSAYQKIIKSSKALELLVSRKGRTLSFQFSLPE